MGVYSNIDLQEINDILNHYHLPKAKEYVATVTGISNSNFKVTLEDGQQVLLKISNDKTIQQLENEQQVLKLLEKYQYPYSLHPFETVQGRPIYQHNGLHGVVFPFVQGLPPQMDNNSCYQIGKALGCLHGLKILPQDLKQIRSHEVVGYGGLSIYEYCQGANAAADFVESFKQVFPRQLQDIPYDEFPVGIIHGDMYFDNTLFHQGQLVTLIDFEQSGRGRHILDVGIALSGSCLNHERDNLDGKLIQSLLEGYESVHKMQFLERDYLKTAVLVGFFSIGLWRIKRFYEGNLDASKKFNYRELLQRAQNFNRSFDKI